MAYQRKYWINRFPVCALVYKEAAEMLGYSEEEAKSLGNARAIFFAAAKRGFGAGVPSKGTRGAKSTMGKYQSTQEKIAKAGVDPDTYDVVNFAGLETYCVLNNDGEVRAFFGGKIIQPGEFDRAVELKMINASSAGTYEKVRRYVRDRLSELNDYELNSVAVYQVYTKIRDVIRTVAFVDEKEMTQGA